MVEIELYLTPSFIKISGDNENQDFIRIQDYLEQFFKIKKVGYGMPKNPMFAQYHFFYKKEYNLLPIGFYNNLIEVFNNIKKNLNISVEIKTIDLIDKQPIVKSEEEIKNAIPNYQFRDYQIEAIKNFFKNNCFGLLEGSVASGKTLIFGAITKLLNLPTLIVLDKIDLAHAGMNEFVKNFGFSKKEVGIVQGNNIMERKITFCTIQSLLKIQNLDYYKFLIFDECHHCCADSYQNLLMISKAPYRLGVSGTISGLEILDFLKIKAFLGDIFYKIETKELVEKKILATPKVFVLSIDTPLVDQMEYGSNWIKIEEDLVVNNEYRNQIIAQLANNKLPRPCLILVRRIKHGEILNQLIPNSIFLKGESETDDRKKYIQLMDKGEDVVVIATDIFNEGINIRELKSLIIGGALKSFVLTKQRAGRGLRKTETKEEIIIVDFFDETHKVLKKQSIKRLSIYKKDQFEIYKINNLEDIKI